MDVTLQMARGIRRARRRRWRYVPRLALHALYRTALSRWVREACRPEEPACARNFAVRGYRHHTRGLDTPPCCRARLLGLLERVGEALTCAGVPWFAFWGTFLGAVRHGAPIPWDRDADLVLRACDRSRALAALAPLLAGPEAAVVTESADSPDTVRLQVSRLNAVGVDLEFWRDDDVEWRYDAGAVIHRVPAAALTPLRLRRFGHLALPTPASLRALLQLYGPDCLSIGLRRDQRFGTPWVRLAPRSHAARPGGAQARTERNVARPPRRAGRRVAT